MRSCHRLLRALVVALPVASWVTACSRAPGPADPIRSTVRAERRANVDIELLGSASIAGDARDRSGLGEKLEKGIPHDRLGSFGSGIAWTGGGERYLAVDDRGPLDGGTTFRDRLQAFDIHVDPGAKPALKVDLVATTLIEDELGRGLVGRATAFDARKPDAGLRFDPEGVRVGRTGTIFLADEYGPSVREFTPEGHGLRRLRVPLSFEVEHMADKNEEKLAGNVRGRVSNHGFEGLAIRPDGAQLYALLQGPLIQDGGRSGVHCRLLEIDLATQSKRQLVVTLSDKSLGFSEILAVDEHRFLVIERDHESGAAARVKRLVLVDIAAATDVSKLAALPAEGLPDGVVAASSTPFLDLLDPRFGLAGASFPEKIEGLAFGPDLGDGRHLLVVTSDNDFQPDEPSWFFAFAISTQALPGFTPQSFATAR